ncbi:hypothetical protein BFW01_g10386 [Lasiodiplodia theobromae]|uniref:Uncharacterized protein n=1 Tax=Lasiodiplodia theobromae TaxID=45133 RepID=A0A8H7MA00_9PEZI|nr:hypothetical protein BFW01_g10386 [Lasiodiplodia theobromae]
MDAANVLSWLNDTSPPCVSDGIASVGPNETKHPHPHEAADSAQVPLSRKPTAELSSMTD